MARLSPTLTGIQILLTPDSGQTDVIVEINRQPVASSEDAVRLCKAAKGDEILVKIWRLRGNIGGTRYLSVDNTKRPK